MSSIQEKHDDYAFHFLNDISNPILQTIAIGMQTQTDSTYYWDNANRYECFLFQYTLNGSGTIELGNEKYLLDKGKCFFIKMPGNTKYYFDEAANEAPWKFIYIMFKSNQIEDYCRYIEKHFGNVFSVPLYSPAIQLLLDLHTRAKNGEFQNPFILNSRVFEFISLLCSKEAVSNEKGTAQNAKEYLDASFNKGLGMNDCASYLSVTQSHLSREFYRQFGERPIDYLTRIRLKEAIKLLTTTDEGLEAISKKCGFSSANYFHKVFKKHIKMTPSEFRVYVKSEGFSNIQI